MTQGEFWLQFLDEKLRTTPDIEFYRDYFLNYKPEKWKSELRGGIFKFKSDNIEYRCSFTQDARYGFIVQYSARDIDKRKDLGVWITVGDMAKLNDVVDIGSDELFSRACFVSAQQAWKVVESFLLKPTELPQLDFLIDSSSVPWPDMY